MSASTIFPSLPWSEVADWTHWLLSHGTDGEKFVNDFQAALAAPLPADKILGFKPCCDDLAPIAADCPLFVSHPAARHAHLASEADLHAHFASLFPGNGQLIQLILQYLPQIIALIKQLTGGKTPAPVAP